VGQFHLVATILQLSEANFGVGANAQDIVNVELDFGSRIGSGSHVIVGQERGIDDTGDPVSGIAAANGNVAVDEADTSDAAFEIVGILRTSGGQTTCQEEDRTRQSQEPEIA
jgi:hypothetical protein